MTKLHDDFERPGKFGSDYRIIVGSDELTVVILADGEEVKRDKKYRLDRVYAHLIRQAYERGLNKEPLW